MQPRERTSIDCDKGEDQMKERMSLRRRWPVAVTIAVLAVAIGAVFGSVRVGSAATKSAPKNTAPPTLSGTAQVGSTLKSSKGEWAENGGGPVSSYKYQWRRCDSNGGSCSNISGADGPSYNVKGVDSGNTLRVRVTATNGDGSSSATSVPSSVVKAAPPTTTAPKPASNGCPSGTGSVSVSQLTSPVVLQIDGQSASPSPIPRNATNLQLRVHISACNGRPVSGALVQTTAVPFNQFSIPAEQPTGSDGWATLNLNRQALFPASPKQQILVVFIRARKPGDPILAGIAGRRLVSFPVSH
jgi:hypothetical protein